MITEIGLKMIEAISQLPIGFLIALSGALLPGPMLAFVVTKTLSGGAHTGPLAATGHILVEFGIIALILLGLGFALQSQIFQTAVGIVGGIFLIALGSLYAVRARGTVELQSKSIGLKYHPLVGGVLFSTILNPSVPLWWATIGMATLAEAAVVASFAGVLFWVAGHFLADLSWFSFVSYSITRGKPLLDTRGHKALLLACGLTLLIFGAYFILRVVPALF